MTRTIQLSLLCLLVLWLVACGTGDTDETTPTPIDSDSKTISTNGGTLEVTAPQGQIQLEFPADAVYAPLEVSLSSKTPDNDSLAHFEIRSNAAGLRAPVNLTITLKTGTAIPPKTSFLLRSGGITHYLPTTFEAGTLTFKTQLTHLAKVPVVSEQLRAQSNGLFSDVELAQIDCQIQADSLSDRILRSQAYTSEAVPSTTRGLADDVAAFMQQCIQEQQDIIGQLQNTACSSYEGALLNANVLIADNAQTLETLVKATLNTTAVADSTGAPCTNISQVQTALDKNYNDFTTEYGIRIDSPDFPNNYSSLRSELIKAIKLWADCQTLGISSEVCNRIQNELLPRLTERQRTAAYRVCRSQGSTLYLGDLISGGVLLPESAGFDIGLVSQFSRADLEQDLQYCASQFTFEVISRKDRTLSDLSRTLQGGSEPGQHQTTTTSKSPVEGTLKLSGSIRALTCNLQGQLSQDELVIKLNNIEVQHIPFSENYLNIPVSLSLEQLLSSAGIDPQRKSSHTLQIFRVGSACGGLYGNNNFKLFEITLEFDPKPNITRVTLSPSSIQADPDRPIIPLNRIIEYEDEGLNLKTLYWKSEYLPGGSVQTTVSDIAFLREVRGSWSTPNVGSVEALCTGPRYTSTRRTFEFEDAFDQISDKAVVTIPISYSNCDD